VLSHGLTGTHRMTQPHAVRETNALGLRGRGRATSRVRPSDDRSSAIALARAGPGGGVCRVPGPGRAERSAADTAAEKCGNCVAADVTPTSTVFKMPGEELLWLPDLDSNQEPAGKNPG
jgi:hypothetical protein